jgi:predicted dehydrogenase
MKTKFAIAGTGTRALNFAEAILNRCSETAELVALYDLNPLRMEGFCKLIGTRIPSYTDYSKLTAETAPDTMIVCVTDKAHPELIEMAFAHNQDVIVEKPMAITTEGINRIITAEKKYNRKVSVTFNMRYQPYAARIREVIMSKPIGEIRQVSAEWFIDLTHGIEYFHRWHSRMENGGGLLVHKATHNFDLLNWFLDDYPEEVHANGSLRYFGPNGQFQGPRCKDCSHTDKCIAAMKPNLQDEDLNPHSDRDIFNKIYFEAESSDGYFRDQCCFRDDIDIYDTMNAMIRYRGGTQVSYALNAYSPWQGYKIVFTGTAGRIEVGAVSPSTRPDNYLEKDTIRIIRGTTRQNITMEEISMEADQSPHGGGDFLMFDQLFGNVDDDPLGQVAGSEAGAMSALVGIGANQSIATGVPVKIPS